MTASIGLLWLLPVLAATSLAWQRELGLLQMLSLVWREWPWALAASVLTATALALRAVVLAGNDGHAQAQARLSHSGREKRKPVLQASRQAPRRYLASFRPSREVPKAPPAVLTTTTT